ncbi:MAG: glycosyltransferase [Polyangiales bacterium]
MTNKRLDAIYITYWSLRDPLCESQCLPYIRGLADCGYRMGLITFEGEAARMSRDDAARAKQLLSEQGVTWRPLRYHQRPPVLSTFADIGVGAAVLAQWCKSSGARLIHARASVPCAIGRAAQATTGVAFFADADGPLSHEYVENGVWKENSIPFRLTEWGESNALGHADAIGVLSESRRRQLIGEYPTPIWVLPCAVDTEKYKPVRDRLTVRHSLGLDGTVFLYTGKLGGRYDENALFSFCEVAYARVPNARFMFLTPHPEAPIRERFSRFGAAVTVKKVAPDEVPNYLAASDVGLSFVRQVPSASAGSPIKVGEYLSAGLPVVGGLGCTDYERAIVRANAGVIVRAYDQPSFRDACDQVVALLEDPSTKDRARRLAIERVGLNEVVLPRYREIYRSLIGAPLGD